MQISLPLDKMSVQEKILTMETLWRDLSRDDSGYESPLWHREVLECREVEGGKFTDWEESKRAIRERACK
jgi:hypothetical protein